jgi:hypothetical protein
MWTRWYSLGKKRAVVRNKVTDLFELVHSLLQPILASPLTPKNSTIKTAGSFFPFCSPWHPIVR